MFQWRLDKKKSETIVGLHYDYLYSCHKHNVITRNAYLRSCKTFVSYIYKTLASCVFSPEWRENFVVPWHVLQAGTVTVWYRNVANAGLSAPLRHLSTTGMTADSFVAVTFYLFLSRHLDNSSWNVIIYPFMYPIIKGYCTSSRINCGLAKSLAQEALA